MSTSAWNNQEDTIMSELHITYKPAVLDMIASMTGLSKPDAEQAIAKIAAAVTKDNTETEADNE